MFLSSPSKRTCCGLLALIALLGASGDANAQGSSWISQQSVIPKWSLQPAPRSYFASLSEKQTGTTAVAAASTTIVNNGPSPRENALEPRAAVVPASAEVLAPDFEAGPPGPEPDPETFLYRLINRLIPEKNRDPSPAPDISMPGPDTANFPNSPFTLPKGRGYLEVSPFNFGSQGYLASQLYSIPFLLRFGLTDNIELRLYSIGYTWTNGPATNAPATTTGFSPLVFDMKMHLWGEKEWMWWPIFGLEVYIQSEIGSPRFVTGVETGISLLVDHNLPGGWLLEWNIGDFGLGFPGEGNDEALNLGISWALQKQLNDKFALFFQGFYNQPDLPFFTQSIVVGLGAQWNINERISAYGSYNWSLTNTGNPIVSYAGLAYAF